VLLVASPKYQDHAVGLPVDVSLKATFKGNRPLVGLALKDASVEVTAAGVGPLVWLALTLATAGDAEVAVVLEAVAVAVLLVLVGLVLEAPMMAVAAVAMVVLTSLENGLSLPVLSKAVTAK